MCLNGLGLLSAVFTYFLTSLKTYPLKGYWEKVFSQNTLMMMFLVELTKIWVDQETWIPLKYDTYDKNGNLTMTIQIQDLKVNTGFPDSEFVFEISSEAKIINPV